MRELQVVGIPNDKEYGFSLEAVEVQQVIHAEILGSNSYQEISPLEVNVVNIAERYAKLCFRIGRFERHASLGHSMVRTFGIQGSSLETSLVTTVRWGSIGLSRSAFSNLADATQARPTITERTRSLDENFWQRLQRV
jgi:hypothetical protein